MLIPFIVTAFVIIADQISKHMIKATMELYDSFPLIPKILNIHYIENEGASFGILKEQRWLFMSLSSVALVFMGAAIFYFARKQIRKNNLLLNAALSCMFGGGIGNMIDRIFNESVNPSYAEKGLKVVVDFLEFDFVDFAIFNLADTFICIGSALFCICIFSGKYKLALFGGEKTEKNI